MPILELEFQFTSFSHFSVKLQLLVVSPIFNLSTSFPKRADFFTLWNAFDALEPVCKGQLLIYPVFSYLNSAINSRSGQAIPSASK
jgi:hypothetical protein